MFPHYGRLINWFLLTNLALTTLHVDPAPFPDQEDLYYVKKLLLTGALALGLASAAHADTFVATGIGTPDSFGFGGFSIGSNGYSNYAGPIQLTNSTSSLLVYCIDLYNGLTVPTTYTFATFNTANVDTTHLGSSFAIDTARIAAIRELGF